MIIASGALYAATTHADAASVSGEPPAPVVSNDQAHNTSVFACFNGGHFSYAEWRLPLPHTCWYPGDVLVQLPAQTIAFKITVPAAISGGSADLTLTELCTVATPQQTADAQNPTYTCSVSSP